MPTCKACEKQGTLYAKGMCRSCYNATWYKKTGRASHRRRAYGLTKTAHKALSDSQAGCCAVCRQELDKGAHVDHCHSHGHVRGLLCNHCNLGIGHFFDDPNKLIAAAKYLVDTTPAQ